jgi:hypothetical protein
MAVAIRSVRSADSTFWALTSVTPFCGSGTRPRGRCPVTTSMPSEARPRYPARDGLALKWLSRFLRCQHLGRGNWTSARFALMLPFDVIERVRLSYHPVPRVVFASQRF